MSLIRVQTRWEGVAGSPYYTNLYALGPLATNNGNDLATAFRTFLVALDTIVHTDATAQIQSELLEFDETTGTVTGAGTTTQAVVNFSGAGDLLPTQSQMLVRWSTAGIVHNRRIRGRTFIPALTESSNTATGVPAAANVAAVLAAANQLLATMTTRMRIWAQPFEGTPENPARAGSAHAITTAAVAPFWATLRSRRD